MASTPVPKMEEGKIFVGGLHAETTKEGLSAYFGQFGEVSDSTIMIDPTTNRSRGFGFVTFKDPAIVHIACAPTVDHRIDGKKVDPKPAYEKGAEAKVQELLHNTKVFVGGISQGTTEDVIAGHFSQYGNVINIDLKYDKNTNRMRGFGFVGFDTTEAAELAAKQRFQDLNGKSIEVKPAEARDRRHRPYGAMYTQQLAAQSYSSYSRPQEFGGGASYAGYGSSYQQYPGYNYGASTGGYNQGGYGAASYAPPQDYTYGRGTSYGQQDFNYPRNYGNQQQMGGYPQAPENSGFNQSRTAYGSSSESYGGHPGYGGYDPSVAAAFSYSEQPTPVGGYGRGNSQRGGAFGYGR